MGIRYEGPATCVLVADPAQMRQVVWNLARNAIQASSAGDEVVVRIRSVGRGAALEVVDHGPGIAADARARLFDAFFTTRSHGVGVGLAVVKQIAMAHGFEVEVDSVENEGTTFRLCIPEAAVPSASPASGDRDTGSSGQLARASAAEN